VSGFANWPISRKLLAGFAAVVMAIFVSSAILYDRLREIEDARAMRVHTTEVLETLSDALDAMVDQETGARGYLISGDKRFLEPYDQGKGAFAVATRKLRELAAKSAGLQRRLNDLEALAEKWQSQIAEQEIALTADPGTRAEARAVESSGAGKAAMDLIRAKVAEIDRFQRGRLAERDSRQKQAFATAYMVTILGGAGSLVIAILMAVLLTRGITVPITRMTRTMTTLARGDTGVDVPAAGRSDEIGAMAAALQVFRDSIIERQRAQAELAHANRVATMGQLTASIAHEVNQPIGAVVTNAEAALRWLRAPAANLDEVRQALDRIVKDGRRASDVIARIRALIRKAPRHTTRFDLNEAIRDVIALSRSEVQRHGVALQTELAGDLAPVAGDRVQLQQVVLNLIVNAVEAMDDMDQGSRALWISTTTHESNGALVAVRDSGPGLDAEAVDRLFEAFYTTKPNGMGMGLAICRSIIEAHGGRMWANANEPRGAIFQFTVSAQGKEPTVA
jgi:signal transduction histidine kinase